MTKWTVPAGRPADRRFRWAKAAKEATQHPAQLDDLEATRLQLGDRQEPGVRGEVKVILELAQ